MTLDNGKYKLVYDEDGAFVSSLVCDGKEYIGGKSPVFTFAARDKDGKQRKYNAFDFAYSGSVINAEGRKFIYRDSTFTVTVKICPRKVLSFYIEIEPLDEENKDFAVEYVNFPQICTPDALSDKGGNNKILWGFNEGVVIDDFTARENGFPYFEPDYPTLGITGMFPAIVETQFTAYFDGERGMYFAAHDRENNLKGINLKRADGGIVFEFRHFTGCGFGEKFELSYPMTVDFFKGEWQNAADIYRNWFEKKLPEGFFKIGENPKLPEWYGKSPVVVTYPVRGVHDMDEMTPNKLFPYENVLPIIEKFEKELESPVMVLLMHWEGTAPWAPPIVWPPYGGEEMLREFAEKLHKRGDVLGVYCSGLGWTLQSNIVKEYNTKDRFEKENLKDEMCISPSGDLPYSRICTGQRAGYDMCPTRDFTVKTVSEQVKNMVGAGIDYVQLMDQNHGGTSYFCYSRRHGHPPVPGKWQVDAVKKLLDTAEKDTGKVIFGCESAAAESYIPYLLFSDNRFNLNYRIGRPVPAYSYIYHEYLNNFMGNQVSSTGFIDHNKSPIAMLERLAYSFSAGDMLTLVINDEGKVDWAWGKWKAPIEFPDGEKVKFFVRNLNYWRRNYAAKFIHTGKMIMPLTTESEKEKLCRYDGSFSTVPFIHTSAFLSEDGEKGQFFINYHDETEKCRVLDVPENAKLDVYGKVSDVSSGIIELEVPPLSAVLVTW